MLKHICDKEKCTACTACLNVCPVLAISMKQNNEGFFYPVINAQKCINCGQCQKICPTNNFKLTYNKEPKCYAAMASDELRRNSSSGAFFPILADHVLSKGGLIAGAAFNENMVLKHIIIAKKENLSQLKGSKYLQSQMSDVYTQTKKALQQNKMVLFTGTPCQVAGLRNFLGKDYDNLITADLICHGVPSQKVYDNYLQSEFPGQKVLNTNFRDNKDDWGCGYITTTTTTTTTTRSLYDSDDSYLQAFFANISLRPSCYDCQFAKMPRTGDFTMGDFWGVPKEMNDRKGTSLILLNNQKAENIFNDIKDKFIKIKEYPVSLPIKIQPNLKGSAAKHPARKDFFKMLEKNSLKDTIESTIKSKKNIGLLNYHWENVNFGAVITAYALNQYLNNQGYYARNIDYVPSFPWIPSEPPNPLFDEFRKKYLPVTRHFNAGESLNELNDEFSTFIVGSDQVWRHEFIKNEKTAYFFSFADVQKKLISFAASFGTETINAPKFDIDEYKALISMFDAVGVREDSGVKICQNLGVKAMQVCDPVFLLTQQQWTDLSNEVTVPNCENDVVFYTINEHLEKDMLQFIENNKDILQYASVKNITWNIQVEEWLYRVKNCKFFVTDSFHGSCFAIIFNKPFVCVNPNPSTSTRMKSLFDRLEIKNRLYSDFKNVDLNNILTHPINYIRTNELIDNSRKYSADFLINAIESSRDRTNEKRNIKAQYSNLVYQQALKNKHKILFKYLKYRILSKIIFGKRRKKYKSKRNEWKVLYQKNKAILTGVKK